MVRYVTAAAAAACAAMLCAAPAAAQGDIQRSGDIVHRPAGAVFPEQVGGFRRTAATQYDAAGRDISASYRLENETGWVVLTLYIYPAPVAARAQDRPAACQAEFASNTKDIRSHPHYRNVQGGEDGKPPRVSAIPPELSRRASYVYDLVRGDNAQRVTSENGLYCFVDGRWLVKYRATATQGFAIAEAIRRFIPVGPWPGRGAGTTTVMVSEQGSTAAGGSAINSSEMSLRRE